MMLSQHSQLWLGKQMLLSHRLLLHKVMRLTAESIQCPDNLKYLAALLKSAFPPSHHLYILLIGHSLLLRQLESHFLSPLINTYPTWGPDCIQCDMMASNFTPQPAFCDPDINGNYTLRFIARFMLVRYNDITILLWYYILLSDINLVN